MKSKAKMAAQLAQPNLVVFPLGPVITSLIFDGVNLFKDRPAIAQVAYWATTLGLIASLVVIILAWIDCFKTPTSTSGNRISLLHDVGYLLVLALLGLSLSWRKEAFGYQPGILALASSGLAFVLLSLTGWLDRELIHRPGLSVGEDTRSYP